MNNQDIAKHSAAMLDLFEAEQQRILLLDPKERAMQHNYQRTMAVCYELRTFIRSIDAKPSAVLEAAPASSASAQAVDANLYPINYVLADAKYLAQSAESFIEYLNDMSDIEDGSIRPDEHYSDYTGAIRVAVHEFRKRLDRYNASVQSQQSPVQASDAGRQG